MKLSETHRVTKQRRVILDTLRERCDHPSADVLYARVREKMPHISLGTVYRNLEVLHTMGLVEKIDVGSGQARYDGDPRPHCHAVCSVCSKVVDVPDRAVTSFTFDYRLIERFEITGHVVLFVGVCRDCREEEGRKEKGQQR